MRRLKVLILALFAAVVGASNYDAYGTNFFADTETTYYGGYQQAWRYLGWYVKCGYPSDRYNDEGSQKSHNSGSGSGDQRWQGNNYCQRFLIWAAYVDENYQGGGIGEYSYYDPYTASWDSSACEVNGNGRCAPMDCHDNNSTTWTLMGVFKEASYFGNDAFFEQLFKHEGVCVWNDEDVYDFMSEAREGAWPEGCVNTGVSLKNSFYDSDYLYIDLKPTWNGNMTYGLYTDSTCKYEYELPDVQVETIAKSMGLLYGDYLTAWNDALEIFKVCQPCRAYNLQNQEQSNYNGNNDDDGGYDPNNGYFQCDDNADYTNVNQCMKFRTHAELEVATWEDLVTATNQGGILEVNISGTIFGSERMSKEDYEVLLAMRQSEVMEEVKEVAQYRRDTAFVNAMQPKAEAWSMTGGSSLAFGMSALVVSICWVVSKHLRKHKRRRRAEPLLARDARTPRKSRKDVPYGGEQHKVRKEQQRPKADAKQRAKVEEDQPDDMSSLSGGSSLNPLEDPAATSTKQVSSPQARTEPQLDSQLPHTDTLMSENTLCSDLIAESPITGIAMSDIPLCCSSEEVGNQPEVAPAESNLELSDLPVIEEPEEVVRTGQAPSGDPVYLAPTRLVSSVESEASEPGHVSPVAKFEHKESPIREAASLPVAPSDEVARNETATSDGDGAARGTEPAVPDVEQVAMQKAEVLQQVERALSATSKTEAIQQVERSAPVSEEPMSSEPTSDGAGETETASPNASDARSEPGSSEASDEVTRMRARLDTDSV